MKKFAFITIILCWMTRQFSAGFLSRPVLFSIAFLLCCHQSAEAQERTLQTFGVQVQHGQPVYPLPSNLSLGLFDADHLLDLACYSDGRIQVWRNMGNGTLGDSPVWEKRVSAAIQKLEWRKDLRTNYIPNLPNDLAITYSSGATEIVSYQQMIRQSTSFASLPQAITEGGPVLNFQQVWQSPRNLFLTSNVWVDDIDNDGKMELIYQTYAGPPAAWGTLVVWENIGNNEYQLDWDTTFNGGYPLAITDIDNDGHKEIVVTYDPGGGNCAGIGLLECFGPRLYRFYSTNICGDRAVKKVLETDVDHNGIKELTCLFSDPSQPYDRTFVDVDEYSGRSICVVGCSGWFMSFSPQRSARYNFYVFDFAVGQVNGSGWDEIILGDAGFLSGGPEDITYLKYIPPDGPFAWRPHYFNVGLTVLCSAPMFVNLDADSAKEIFIGGVGPHGHGSAYAIKNTVDSTWQPMWVDSTCESSPLWVNTGKLYQSPVVAASNWFNIGNETYSTLRLYKYSGEATGTWRRDSAVIWMFHLLDIDHDSLQNLVFAQGSLVYGHRAVDFEIPATLAVRPPTSIPAELQLFPNYPNPFNPSTTIKYDLPEPANVSLIIYDILGRKVAELVNEEKSAGYHSVVWDAADVASGVYLARFTAFDANGYSKYSKVNKLVLMK